MVSVQPVNLRRSQLDTTPDIVWEGGCDRIVLSASAGGRVISWRHGRAGELVRPPDVTDGGLLRVLFGEERYPGSLHVTPHIARVLRNDERGFEIHLRCFSNTPNLFARLLGWSEKVNPVYLDGLWIDKTVSFDAGTSALSVELAITNLSGQTRRVSPWLHNQFQGWVDHAFVVSDGRREPYVCRDIWWAGHLPQPGKPMRLVNANKDGSLFTVLGADTAWLVGMTSLTRADFGEDSTDGCMELRGKTITLAQGQRWSATAFLALTDKPDGWQHWAIGSPVDLFSRVEDVPVSTYDPNSLLPLLSYWALPEEQQRGLMVLSFHDKVPFTSASRYAAANSFAGFHLDETGQHAQASVVLFPLRELNSVQLEMVGTKNWRIVAAADHGHNLNLPQHKPSLLTIEGPPDLAGKETVEVRLSIRGESVSLRVSPDATVEPRQAYQVKQTSTYLDERWRSEKGGFNGHSPEEFHIWQKQARASLLQWTREAVIGPAPLAPRLMERQVGPYCVREKILLQTEPGMWLPSYLIYPKRITHGTKMPAILFPHGSGPGKLHFAPDETAEVQDSNTFDQWPSPYQFAHQLGCLVLLPDRRGWGEWSEANHGQRSQRAARAGYNIVAMDVWDHLRAVDYLVQRPDVDTSRIVSMGSSGGGWITLFVMGADERVAGGIVSSSVTTMPSLPEQYFFQTFPDENAPINPPPFLPLAPATILCLAAPRVLWIMDGKWDRGVLPTLPHTEQEAKTAFARWHAEATAGREEIERVYRIIGAEKCYQSSWFDGGHLAGFTFHNITAWARQHFGITQL